VRDLLHSLVPRAHCFCFYDGSRRCTWSSDGVEDAEVDQFVGDLPREWLNGHGDEPWLRRTLVTGRIVFALPVGNGEGGARGVLVSIFSRNAGTSSGFNPAMLYDLLAPVVALLGAKLASDRRIDALEARSARLEHELSLVYEVDERIHSNSRSHAGLAKLVGQSGRFLDIAYSVLLIPAKRIRISATHSSWRSVNRKIIDRYLIDHLLPKIEGRKKPVIFEIPSLDGAQAGMASGCQTLLTPVLDRNGTVEGVLAQLGRVNDQAFADNHRRFMSHIGRKVESVIEQSFDVMTGLMNRAGFEAQMRESHRALAAGNDCHQLIYFDVDNLKLVNDKFGTKAGDDVISRVAASLSEDLPRTSVLARLEGDDFCILLTHADTDEALELADRARERFAGLRYLQGDESLQLSVSIGIAEFNARNGVTGEALTAARMAVDAAKEQGREQIHVYDGSNQSMIRRHDDMNLVAEIQRALDESGFELEGQPIMALDGSDAISYEILLRLRTPDGQAVATDAFMSAAERYRMMPQVDRWVVSNSLRTIAEHRAVFDARDVRLAINLSGQSLSDDEMLQFILGEIEQTGVDPSSICFEITESAAVSNFRKAQNFIHALRERGCRIALDDFGAGLSSFAYLKNFTVDTLKIDGGFIRDIADNQISESMVAAITEVAKVMGLKTVAEYVETDAIREIVARKGVTYAQGHGIGRPVALSSIIERLSNPDLDWLQR
jgi:diguanylate cyclase (GGDEF)-like protein